MANQQSTPPATVDELLSLLADRYRRSTIAYLRDASEQVASVGDIAAETSNGDGTGTAQVALQLHHSSLPQLADAGVVEYDVRSRTAKYDGHRELETLLAGIEEAVRRTDAGP